MVCQKLTVCNCKGTNKVAHACPDTWLTPHRIGGSAAQEYSVADELLCRCKYFEVYRMLINTERRQKVTYSSDELSFRVLLCYDGCGNISYHAKDGRKEYIDVYKGDCIFIPANSRMLIFNGMIEFLEVKC